MNILRAANLESPRVAHGFFGREGGVSQGIFASLNCGPGSDDERENVFENRRRATDALNAGSSLLTLYQIHSPDVVTVTAPWNLGKGPQADAMVTRERNIALGILTADCAPVLFADEKAGVIGAAHAGWRGALAGVTDATIAAMEELGARRDRIQAAVGPCVAQASYEVDEGFRIRFLEADPANHRFFTPGPAGKPHFDLPGYLRERLGAAHLASFDMLGLDTYADPDRFYSYRRATHRGEPDYGRQVSLIGLPAKSA